MFKQKKNKRFNYQPRFSKENQSDSNAEENPEKEFVSRWRATREGKRKVKGTMSVRILILALVLLLIVMYVLEKRYM
ncbi:hypothetical protein E1J38_006645 [Seonamhaeicola sediminis]|uniref:Uncharacterized protein n=1 Tax=Seonamhaeicola sediminis TaxID=2528206 RepID=A0A562YCY4_9FLAO|nr:hypothetical protein [Seonamhaeicola sediminis]TWO32547.1 hypothetical protein E1J38_006645 [Seonamhaeicola sediminis]